MNCHFFDFLKDLKKKKYSIFGRGFPQIRKTPCAPDALYEFETNAIRI